MNNDLTNLERTIFIIEDTQYCTLCNIDTLIRVDDTEEDLCNCQNCVFNDTKEQAYLGCPYEWAHILRQSERK